METKIFSQLLYPRSYVSGTNDTWKERWIHSANQFAIWMLLMFAAGLKGSPRVWAFVGLEKT